MGKRAAKRNQSKSPSTRSPVEPLEGRVMMSTTPAIVTIDWGGYKTRAYQGQYLTEVNNTARFDSLVTAEKFTGVKSLGANFYQFDSTLPVDTIRKLGESVNKTLKTIEPNRLLSFDNTIPNDPLYAQQYGLTNSGQLESFDYNQDSVVSPYSQQVNATPPVVSDFPSPPYPNENQYGLTGDDVDAQTGMGHHHRVVRRGGCRDHRLRRSILPTRT